MRRLTMICAMMAFCHIVAFGQKKYEMVVEKTDGTNIVVRTEDVVRSYFREREEENFSICPDENHPHMIDLGLPSGTKWACCNVGAATPEAYGGYYAWGETVEKDYYDWSTYTHCDGSMSTCHNIGSDIAGTQYDVAYMKWGESWVMPSHDQQMELLNNCTSEWTTLNGVNGRKFTGSNGGSIFLPAAGLLSGGELNIATYCGHYWSSTNYQSTSYTANILNFGRGAAGWSDGYRCDGKSVRPVSR